MDTSLLVKRLRFLAWAACALLAGCTQKTSLPPTAFLDPSIPGDALIVPGNQPWVDSGIDIARGEAVTILGRGLVRIGRIKKPKGDAEYQVGPQGTFLYADDLMDYQFPLAAAGSGPAPCFCLIGRIGFSEPFFVGEGRSWVAEESGRLYLGINDFDPAANLGEFYAEVQKPNDVQPLAYREDVPLDAPPSGPSVACSAVVIYIDGLRPDVLEEMAAMQHIPHLKERFIDGGTYLVNAFTVFPSDTITSNGTMWTGCFSDRHGMKGQARFSRHRLVSESFLEPMGPNRSSRSLGPQGLDKFFHETAATSISLAMGEKEGHEWRQLQTSGTPAIYDHLRAAGSDWATGMLPLMTDVPPILWTRSMTQFLPYLQSHQAWRYLDDANSHYAVRHLIRQNLPVTIIWLPETDSVSHKECRGQFGSTRRTIARADKLVGEIVKELECQGRLEQTYFVLVSDHGHLGGQNTHLSRFDIANELFYESRRITKDRRWVGGGLGLSVRQHRYANWHKGDDSKHFVFVDSDSDGAARVFLPKGCYRSGDWTAANNAAQLLAYRVDNHIEPINLPVTLANAQAEDDGGCVRNPVDLVLMKLSDCSILITTCDRGQAVIERQRNEDGSWVYRYTPVENVCPMMDGSVSYSPVTDPRIDPLGIVQRVRRGFLQSFHDERTWLWVTALSEYPDSVVALTRHMLWQDNLKLQECEYAPDFVVTARHGWLFGIHNSNGTTHGYPLPESMHATWYVSGPGVRRGARVEAPCRLADLTPTLLELTGTPYDPTQLDGHALRTIYTTEPGRISPVITHAQAHPPETALRLPRERPMYWRDFDLRAWQPLDYAPLSEHEHMPLTINRPNSGLDLNNVAYNVIAIGDWSVFKLVDDALSPLTPGRTRVNQTVDQLDRRVNHVDKVWVANGASALNVPEVTLSDYSLTSLGNLKRADGAVDWVQERGTRLDRKLAEPIGKRTVLGTPASNAVVDTVQDGFWEVYRFAQRIVAEVLDDVVLNGVENGVDSTINLMRSTPSEITVDDSGRAVR